MWSLAVCQLFIPTPLPLVDTRTLLFLSQSLRQFWEGQRSGLPVQHVHQGTESSDGLQIATPSTRQLMGVLPGLLLLKGPPASQCVVEEISLAADGPDQVLNGEHVNSPSLKVCHDVLQLRRHARTLHLQCYSPHLVQLQCWLIHEIACHFKTAEEVVLLASSRVMFLVSKSCTVSV